MGRTGRNQAQGDAFAFVSPEEEGALRAIERAIGSRMPRITLPDFDYAAQKTNAPEAAKFRENSGRGRSSSPKPYTRFGANRGGQGAGGRGGERPQSRPHDAARPARSQAIGSGIRGEQGDRPARPAADRFAQAAATNSRQALRGAEASSGETGYRPRREGGGSFGGAKRKPFRSSSR